MQTVKVHIAPLLITGRMTTRIHFWLHLYIMAKTEITLTTNMSFLVFPKHCTFATNKYHFQNVLTDPGNDGYGLTLAMIKSHPSSVLHLVPAARPSCI